jgi:hypothetical protein
MHVTPPTSVAWYFNFNLAQPTRMSCDTSRVVLIKFNLIVAWEKEATDFGG